MNLMTAQTIAKMLMREHGLDGWTFKWDGAKRRLGCTHYRERTISLSRHLTVNRDEAEVRNTILHEIAHVIAGYDAGHGVEWRRVAVRIGCDGKRCGAVSEEQKVAPNWLARCPNGHVIAERYRRPAANRRHSCTRCSPTFDARYLISWVPANGRTLAQMQS